ncbi:MAG TPA: hypothetical protein VMH86_01605 [Rhizomicrobium sp.]|nr:hypothetical protein [Rhizomicrobium sp.]
MLGNRHAPFIVAPLLATVFGLALFIVIYWHDGILRSLTAFSSDVLRTTAVFSLLAIGAALVISSSYIDLSAMGVATVSGVIFAAILSHFDSVNVWSVGLATLASLFFSLLSGFGVSFSVVNLRAPPLIFTWAIGSIYGLIAILLTSLAADRVAHSVAGVPLHDPVSRTFWQPTGWGFYLSIATVLGALVLILGVDLARRACAIGANETSAVYAGVSKRRTLYECFVINALLAGGAGILEIPALNSEASTGDLIGKELIPIAIAVLGGTALTGGYINLLSVIAAAIFWAVAELIGPQLQTYIPELSGAEVGKILFFFLFVLVVLAFGRFLGPPLPKIYAKKEGT